VERPGEGISTCGDGVRRVMSIHQCGPDQSQPTFRVLNQCGTVFNPVPGVAVHKAVDIKCHGFVDMTTDYTMTASPSCVANDEFANSANMAR
jgi:hypothetical protein